MFAAATPVFTTKCRVELAKSLVMKPSTFSLHAITPGGTRISTGILINSAAYGTTSDVGHEGPITPESGRAGTPTVSVGTTHSPAPLNKSPFDLCIDCHEEEEEDGNFGNSYWAEVAPGLCPLGTNKIPGEPNPICYHGVTAKEAKSGG